MSSNMFRNISQAKHLNTGSLAGAYCSNKKIRPGDLDAFVEENRQFLYIECKHGSSMPNMGQAIAFRRRLEVDRGISTYMILHHHCPQHHELIELEDIFDVQVAWFDKNADCLQCTTPIPTLEYSVYTMNQMWSKSTAGDLAFHGFLNSRLGPCFL